MKFAAKSAAWLLPFFLTACISLPRPFHKNKPPVQAIAPPVDLTPPVPPTETVVDLPPLPLVPVIRPPEPPANAEAQPPKSHGRHKKAPAAPPEPEQSPQETQAVAENPGVSAVGQLSTGEPGDVKRQTVDLIVGTERGLDGIGRKLNDQELKTASQIREFLKQARTAMVSGDVDGAHTLAAKARVLLSELSQ